MKLPWLPPGHTAVLPGRGEVFYRHHRCPAANPADPTLLLLHGWTANADTQFFAAYEALAERYSFVALDHRGHGRGMRAHFTLEDAADDAAALIQHLGVGPVVTIGYSMGGPISLLLTDRHPELVGGLVVQATSMEWRASRGDRLQWQGLRLLGFGLRSRWYPKLLRLGVGRLTRDYPEIEPWLPWLEGEIRRNDPVGILEAGLALSRYDARPWAEALQRPSAMLVTTADRLVRPRKQWALARALGAEVRAVPFDHLVTLTHPTAYAEATRELVDHVMGAIAARRRATA